MALVLKVLNGQEEGQLLAIPNGQSVTLGRSKEASYPFQDKLLSREHCSVSSNDGVITVRDLESRNGTFVNGARIELPVRLAHGDRLKIGATIIEVSDPSRPEPPPPPPALDKVALPALPGFEFLECVQVTPTGPVYRARQQLMQRLVAVKTFSTSENDEEERARRRFMREAKAGGRLDHPSIVELYDVNEHGGVMYLVLEWIEGETLEEKIRARGALPAAEVLPWMRQIAEALQYAHEKEIVHRNVRPETVIVRATDGRAKLTDFTVAKRVSEDRSIITLAGESLGTPLYMPPEVIRNALAADRRSDVYSYGATFYHALSNEPPVDARSLAEFLRKVMEKPPALAEVVPGIDARVSAIVEWCMEKDPEKRPQGMEEVVAALAAIG